MLENGNNVSKISWELETNVHPVFVRLLKMSVALLVAASVVESFNQFYRNKIILLPKFFKSVEHIALLKTL